MPVSVPPFWIALDDRHHHTGGFPHRCRRSHLPGRICLRQLDQSPHPDQYQQPGRGAIHHLWHVRIGDFCARPRTVDQRRCFWFVEDPTTANGRTILSAGFTLALLVLPILIINGQEAIRSCAGFAAPGQLWPGSHKMADRLAPCSAQCNFGHPDRNDPGDLPCHR